MPRGRAGDEEVHAEALGQETRRQLALDAVAGHRVEVGVGAEARQVALDAGEGAGLVGLGLGELDHVDRAVGGVVDEDHVEQLDEPGLLGEMGGAVGIGVLADNGERTFVELSRIRTHRNTDKSGYRWYHDYRLPDHLGGGTITSASTARSTSTTASERQHLNLLTHALGVNSLALWRHRHRAGDPPVPLAA